MPVSLFRRFALTLALLATGCRLADSDAPPIPPGDVVRFVWAGGVTPYSVTVNAGLRRESSRVRLLVSPEADLGEPIVSPYYTVDRAQDNVVSITLSGLQPDTDYHYAVEADGRLDKAQQGRFRTFAEGPFSFTIAFASCADTGSNHPVFDTIRELRPLFFLHLGDFHYEDVSSPRRSDYVRAYEAVLASPRQSLLYREVPIVYMWDDHDFGGNDSDRTSPGRRTVRLVYQDLVPHYPLPAGRGDVPVYQAFTAGRVRFVVTDLRSERSPSDARDDRSKTMMGPAQKAWFERELLAAQQAGQLVVWVSTPPWIQPPTRGSDRWGGYSTERREIADFIARHRIDRLAMLSGDAHMVAIDDGSHTDYATGGGAGFPLMHAAALDRRGSVKGGPYSEGTFPNRTYRGRYDGQFGVMEVRDEGGPEICIDWSGRRQEYRTERVVKLVSWEKCFQVPRAEVGLFEAAATSAAPPS